MRISRHRFAVAGVREVSSELVIKLDGPDPCRR